MRSHRWSTDGGIHEIPLPDVATGRMWLCGKHHIAPDVEGVLRRTGADTVVCLTQRHELEDRFPDYVTWLTAHAGAQALWFPIHDLNAPASHDDARELYDEIVRRVDAGRGVVVHCAAGIGRAGTTAIAVLMLLGMPLDEARVHVRAHRPMAGPEAGSQLEFLERLAATLNPG